MKLTHIPRLSGVYRIAHPQSGGPHTEAAKAKIAAKAKARGALSEAHRKALSDGQKRRGPRGPHTAERCANISAAKKRAFAARQVAI